MCSVTARAVSQWSAQRREPVMLCMRSYFKCCLETVYHLRTLNAFVITEDAAMSRNAECSADKCNCRSASVAGRW
jgi:hypothetical protein